MQIDLIAQIKTYEDFIENYKDGDEKKLFHGKNLLFYSLSNTKVNERYKISNFLIEKNIDPNGINAEGQNVFHVLLAQNTNELSEVIKLCKYFFMMGVDVNQKDKNGQMPIHYLAKMGKKDEELNEIYNLFFSQDNLDLFSKDKIGYTPIEFVAKLPYRKNLLERMLLYVQK